MKVIEIFGRKLTIVEDNTNTCKKCALSDICPFKLMPCKDANSNVNRRFEKIKE
jgi:Na+-translocating ferredoxin:NAD+ oxidoreductase RnfC subunit